jgi:hypothetical protein
LKGEVERGRKRTTTEFAEDTEKKRDVRQQGDDIVRTWGAAVLRRYMISM